MLLDSRTVRVHGEMEHQPILVTMMLPVTIIMMLKIKVLFILRSGFLINIIIPLKALQIMLI